MNAAHSQTQKPDVELTLSDKAYLLLRQSIVRGEVLPGDKLKMDALQREYSLSSSPLREALNRLTAEGLVVSEGNRGFRVAPVSLSDLDDIVRLRIVLEREAIESAIAHGNDEWEAGIVAAFYRLEREEKRIYEEGGSLTDEWTERHRDFHMALFSGADSTRLIGLCSSLFDQAERYRRLSAIYRKTRKNKANEHRALMEAVLSRDVSLATEKLREHVTKTAENVTAAMKAQMAGETANS